MALIVESVLQTRGAKSNGIARLAAIAIITRSYNGQDWDSLRDVWVMLPA